MPPPSSALSPAPDDGTAASTSPHRGSSGHAAEPDRFFNDGPDGALMPHPAAHAERDVRSMWLRPLLALGVMGAIYMAGAWAAGRSSQPPPVGPFASQGMATKPVVVHVAGHVKHPGVYSLAANARVEDALQKAGGALPDGDPNALNLAAWAEDGQKIEVPAKAAPQTSPRLAMAPVEAPPAPAAAPESAPQIEPQQAAPPIEAPVAPPIVAPLPDMAAPLAPPEPARSFAAPRSAKRAVKAAKKSLGVPAATTPSGKASTNASPDYLAKHPINLNTATAEQLQLLPGVGPKMAEKIIEYRAQNGGFKAIEQLDDVKGIGEKKLEKLRPLVSVR